MRKNILLLCISLITFATSIFYPSKAIALSGDNTFKAKGITDDITLDEKMLYSKYNCDPKMLVSINDNDPKFLVKPGTKNGKNNGK